MESIILYITQSSANKYDSSKGLEGKQSMEFDS